MEPDLNDLIAQLPDDEARDLIAGLALPPDYTLSRLIFEMIEAYYAAQKRMNGADGTSLEFVSPPTNSEVMETADGSYEMTRKYTINGVIRLGITSFQPLDLTPETDVG